MIHKNSPNHLAAEKSPYLQQHADNPVDWYPWGEEVLEKAQKEDKPILISIGYAACHWCHVMERESFTDREIAGIMNQYFVCVKVDREERPDLDHIYMTAVQLIHRHGGWPLNVFALPDGKPFYGGTYFRPDQWAKLMKQIHQLYQNERQLVEKQALQIAEGITGLNLVTLASIEDFLEEKNVDDIFVKISRSFDKNSGGSLGAPKFPLPVQFGFLLRYAFQRQNSGAKHHMELSLDKMAKGGIYDHIGGGFYRYAVDSQWHIPHFEKMLYDNAQLISLYAEAYQFFNKAAYAQIIRESIKHLEDIFQLPGGGFSCSLDADSEGEEGKFYVWSAKEIREILGEKAPLFLEAYQVDTKALWEDDKNVLWQYDDLEALAIAQDLSLEDLLAELQQSRKKLLENRQKRISPALDDKVLTGWNAMMVKAYIDAGLALGEEGYLKKALELAHFLIRNLKKDDGSLWRVYKDGQGYTEACLEDYAWLISALTGLYQASLQEEWLQQAVELTHYVIQHFFDPEHAMFWQSSDQVTVPVARQMETHDNVIPSSNAVMARNLFHLGHLLEDERYTKLATQGMANMTEAMLRQPSAYLHWAILYMEMTYGLTHAVITGPQCLEYLKELQQHFDPFRLMAGARDTSSYQHISSRMDEDKTLVFICTPTECLEPVSDSDKALAIMKNLRKSAES